MVKLVNIHLDAFSIYSTKPLSLLLTIILTAVVEEKLKLTVLQHTCELCKSNVDSINFQRTFCKFVITTKISKINNIKISTLNTTIPHDKLNLGSLKS